MRIKIHILIFLLLLFCSHSARGDVFFYITDQKQQSAEDYFKQGQQHLYSDPSEARRYATLALEKITDQQLTLRLQILNFIGISYMMQSAYDQALQFFHPAAEEALQNNHWQQMSNSYNNIAVVHSDLGNYKDALHYYMRSLDGYEKAGKSEASAAVFTNMGKIYAEMDNPQRASENFDAALEIFFTLYDSIRIATVYSSISAYYLRIQKPDSAMYFADQAIVYSKNARDLYLLCNTLEMKARTHLLKQEYESADKYFMQAMDIANEIGFFSGLITILNGQAEMHKEKGSIDLAVQLGEESLQIAKKIENNKLIYITHELLSGIHAVNNDSSKAYDHFLTYYRLKNESVSQNRLHQVYNLELERAAQVSMREIALREQLLTRKNTTIIFILLAFALVMVILVLVYYIHQNRQRQKHKRQKDETLLRLTEERARASLQAEISERRRLGLELHDGASPLLSLARMNITALLEKNDISQERKNKLLGHTIDTLDQLLEEMKGISQNMASVVLFEKGFEAAIRDLIDKINQTNGYVATVDISGVNGQLETYVEHTLYRTVQEAVNNILTHARASNIHIQVIANQEDLTIMVEDNGTGFDEKQAEPHKGMGIKSIASRIQGLKGEFFIDSVVGRGTIVTMIIPLN